MRLSEAGCICPYGMAAGGRDAFHAACVDLLPVLGFGEGHNLHVADLLTDRLWPPGALGGERDELRERIEALCDDASRGEIVPGARVLVSDLRAALADDAWQAGDPCGVCGSTETYEGLPHEGARCAGCGAGDDDD